MCICFVFSEHPKLTQMVRNLGRIKINRAARTASTTAKNKTARKADREAKAADGKTVAQRNKLLRRILCNVPTVI